MTSASTILTNIFKRRTSVEQPTWLVVLGILTVTIYAFSRTGFPEAAKISSAIAFFTGFWGLYKYGSQVNSHILLRFVWIAVIFQFIAWGLSLYVTPEWAEDTPQLDKVTRWFIFIPFAWWVTQRKNSIWLVWSSAALGILVSPWVTGDGIPEFIRGLNGERVFFGLRQAQHTSLFFGVILIGLMCFARPIFQKNKWLIIPLIITFSYCLLIIYINSSRQAWLSLLLTIFLVATYFTLKRFNRAQPKKKIITGTLFFIGLFSVSILLTSSDTMVKRVMKEKSALNAIATLNFDDVPYSSFGIRLHSWIAATDFIAEKPLFGWGDNGKSLVMKHTEWLPDNIRNNFGHLHNTYIELLVNYGIVGLVFYLSIWVYIGKRLYKQIKTGKIEKEIGYFFTSFLIFWSIMNCFEAYQNFWTGSFFFIVFMTGIQSKIWRAEYKLV
ncbi:O-antigen ligase family protein [Marinomonas sp. RSW2]|uniref:O-antigen ligase family protein n=1 Tax=Marinomonas maritima TaxID=2940935 RepID=A0ABT5WH92_9GAMM|nr:O-antigen ligase family protein [Marinomonas maritima]MDE8604182.1 O-antigen ligase family protein [Marinomonas maritima]